jgi:hypothetical protein
MNIAPFMFDKLRLKIQNLPVVYIPVPTYEHCCHMPACSRHELRHEHFQQFILFVLRNLLRIQNYDWDCIEYLDEYDPSYPQLLASIQ